MSSLDELIAAWRAVADVARQGGTQEEHAEGGDR